MWCDVCVCVCVHVCVRACVCVCVCGELVNKSLVGYFRCLGINKNR